MPSVRFTDSDGFTTIPVKNWPDAFAGVNQTPRKFAVENNGSDRALGATPGPANGLQLQIDQIGTNDGNGMLRIGADTATLSPPYALAAVLGPATGVWGSTGTRGWKVTAVNAVGETIGSFEATFNVTSLGNAVTLTWTQITGATNYKIYRTDTPGTYGATSLRATVGAVGTFDDTGAALSSGTPPSANTTGGWKLTAALGGAGGVWGSTGQEFWVLAAYDSTNVLIALSIEANFNVTDTTKKVTLTWPTIAAADHYILYRSTGTGVYNTPAIRATIAGGTVTFDDDGSALTTGTITYSPSYGIPPALSTVPVVIGTAPGKLAIGQQWFFWVNRVIPGATSEAGNPRSALTTVKEI
jgi:hypothetical protein